MRKPTSLLHMPGLPPETASFQAHLQHPIPTSKTTPICPFILSDINCFPFFSLHFISYFLSLAADALSSLYPFLSAFSHSSFYNFHFFFLSFSSDWKSTQDTQNPNLLNLVNFGKKKLFLLHFLVSLSTGFAFFFSLCW